MSASLVQEHGSRFWVEQYWIIDYYRKNVANNTEEAYA